MNSTEALKIIEALASGNDPVTGKPLRKSSPVSQPRVIRALFVAARALLVASVNEIEVQPKPPLGMAGKPWTEEEEKRLLAGFDAGSSLQKLAEDHARNVGGIESRLVRLGRLTPSSA